MTPLESVVDSWEVMRERHALTEEQEPDKRIRKIWISVIRAAYDFTLALADAGMAPPTTEAGVAEAFEKALSDPKTPPYVYRAAREYAARTELFHRKRKAAGR